MLAAILMVLIVFVIPANAEDVELPITEDVPTDQWLEANDVRIRSVVLDKGNIFDTDKPGERKSLFRLANRLHFKTRDSTIENQLLFNVGDTYSRRVLDESERILRSNRYFYDANINAVNYDDGMVDIVVTTRDVWTLNVGISASRSGGANESSFELEEQNLFGLGTKLSADFTSDVDRDAVVFEYSEPHLAGSWTQLSVKLADRSDGDMFSLLLDRPFYSLDTRWAGGIEVLQDERTDQFYELGSPVAAFQHDRSFAQIYAGFSNGLSNNWVSRWSVGVALDQHRFAPSDMGFDLSAIPTDRKYVYPFIRYDLIEDRFSKTKNHNHMDRTEDVNLGTYLSAKMGVSASSLGADDNALLYNLRSGTGFGSPEKTMLRIDGSLDGSLRTDKEVSAHLGFNVRYYRRQSDHRSLYAGASFLASQNPTLDKYVDLGGDIGLRGYPLRYQTGEGSVLVTLEQRFFTDWYPFKLFRVGGAVFGDAGRTFGQTPFGTDSIGWLTDVGFGLRLGSTRSGSGKMLHLDIAFPLNGDTSIDGVQFLVETRRGF